MVQIIDFGTPLHDELLNVRTIVLREPLDMVFYGKDIAVEYTEIHFAYLNQNYQILGSLQLKDLGNNTMKMRQVCVLPEASGKGIGKALVAASENYCIENGIDKIVLHARETAIPFYDKLEYKPIGKPFSEVNIPHMAMEKLMK